MTGGKVFYLQSVNNTVNIVSNCYRTLTLRGEGNRNIALSPQSNKSGLGHVKEKKRLSVLTIRAKNKIR